LTCFEFKALGSSYNGKFWQFGRVLVKYWLKQAIYSFCGLSLGKQALFSDDLGK